jgi:hypothetical protein
VTGHQFVLKAGWCTALFRAFLMDKGRTMYMKGGNTDELYANGRLEFAQSLQRQHPDVVRVGQRYGRWHHVVDYSPFRHNRLRLKKGVRLPPAHSIDDFDMVLRRTRRRKKGL